MSTPTSQQPPSGIEPNSLTPTQPPQPETDRKPLLSADTLYEPVVYSATAMKAPLPYSYRTEYDRTNPINIPQNLTKKRITLVTTPTDVAKYHNYNILCPDAETARALELSLYRQYSNLMSPLYLLQLSRDYNSRVVTKDQIPSLIDEKGAALTPNNLPQPLISLNIPTVSTITSNPTPTLAESVVGGAFAGAIIHGIARVANRSIKDHNGSLFNSNFLHLSNFPNTYLAPIARRRIFRSFTGASLPQGMAIWAGFSALHHTFNERRLAAKKSGVGMGIGGVGSAVEEDLESSFEVNFATNGKIIVESEPDRAIDLPFAVTIKAPPIWDSPLEQTVPMIQAALVTAPLSYLATSRRFYEDEAKFLINRIGMLPPEIEVARDKIMEYLIAKSPFKDKSIPKPTPTTPTPTTNPSGIVLPKKQFPSYGIINKKLYEAFFWDHGSPHLYSQYENGQITQPKFYNRFNPLFGFKHWKNILFPSAAQLEEYKAIIGRDAASILSGTTHHQPTPPPISLTTIPSRLKFHLASFACVVGLWAHFTASFYAFQVLKSQQLAATGNPPLIRQTIFGGADDLGGNVDRADKVYQNEIMEVPNLAVPAFTRNYFGFKQSGDHGEIWKQSKVVQADEMLSAKTKLDSIRNHSQQHFSFTEWAAQTNTTPELLDVATKFGQERAASPVAGVELKTANAWLSTLGVSFFSSWLFYPTIFAQTRKIFAKTTYKPAVHAHMISFAVLSTIIHAVLLGKFGGEDVRAFARQQSFLEASMNAKTASFAYESTNPSAITTALFRDPDGFMDQSQASIIADVQKKAFFEHFNKLSQEKLILPSKNPKFYTELQETLYTNQPVDPETGKRRYEYLSHATALPYDKLMSMSELYNFTGLSRYASQMIGYNFAYRDGSHDTPIAEVKYLPTRGQYFLPFQNLPHSCNHCSKPVQKTALDISPCLCDEIDFRQLQEQTRSH